MPHSDYTLYDGGGTSSALQVDTTGATRVASTAVLIDTTGYECVDVWLMNETASATATLYCAEYSQNKGDTPAVIKEIRKQEIVIPAAEQAGTVDRAAWGLTTGTERAPKAPVRFIINPGSAVMIGLQAASTGTFYARVALVEGHAAGTLDLDPAGDTALLTAIEADTTAILADTNELTAAPVSKALTKVVKAVTTPSTAVALVASQTFCRKVELQARKVAGDNTGALFVGLSDLDQGVAELIELAAGDSWSFEAVAGTKLDLNTIYIDADNAADGVVGWYLAV